MSYPHRDAPFGYTKTGRIRKHPLKTKTKTTHSNRQQSPIMIVLDASPSPPPLLPQTVLPPLSNPLSTFTPTLAPSDTASESGICSVCGSSFQHRPDPKKALWQHLNHFIKPGMIDDGHKKFHAEKKVVKQQQSGTFHKLL
jgi:hypothetical protein